LYLLTAGNLNQVYAYAAERGLRPNDLFWAMAQAILKMVNANPRDWTLLEAVPAWGRGDRNAEIAVQPTFLRSDGRTDAPFVFPEKGET
jgi:hypothetical protein